MVEEKTIEVESKAPSVKSDYKKISVYNRQVLLPKTCFEYSPSSILEKSYNIHISLKNEDYFRKEKTSLYEAVNKVKEKVDGLESVIDEEVDNFVSRINSHASQEEDFDLSNVKVFINSYTEYGELFFSIRYDYLDEDFERIII